MTVSAAPAAVRIAWAVLAPVLRAMTPGGEGDVQGAGGGPARAPGTAMDAETEEMT
jgi:hypothetical protein